MTATRQDRTTLPVMPEKLHLIAFLLLAGFLGHGCTPEPQGSGIQPDPAEPVDPSPGTATNDSAPSSKTPTAAFAGLPIHSASLPDHTTSPFLHEGCFLRAWSVLGPFAINEQDFGGGLQSDAIRHPFLADEASLTPDAEAPANTAWTKFLPTDTRPEGGVDIGSLYDDTPRRAAYAVTWVQCPEDISGVTLHCGSDGYMLVYLNGQAVYTYADRPRRAQWDQDIAENLSLRKGRNHLVVKTITFTPRGRFFLRLTDARGRPIQLEPPE